VYFQQRKYRHPAGRRTPGAVHENKRRSGAATRAGDRDSVFRSCLLYDQSLLPA
jgi:hypothetical protein